MDNDDAKTLLLHLRRLALEPYPFPEGSTADLRYAMALGLIAGICDEAIQAVRQNRRANFQTEEQKRC